MRDFLAKIGAFATLFADMSAKPSSKVVRLATTANAAFAATAARGAKRVQPVVRNRAFERFDARVAQLEILIAALDHRITRGRFNRRFQITLTASILLHIVVLALVTFAVTDKTKPLNNQPMEVVLVNAKSATKPTKADVQAQNNLDGGGNTDADRRAKSPLPVLRNDAQLSEVAVARKRVEQIEQKARTLMTQAKSKTEMASAPRQVAPQPPQLDVQLPSIGEAEIQRSLAIQRMQAAIEKPWDNYQKRPRKQFVGARAEMNRFARYVEDWRVKIERVGELNYPQAARDQRIYGSLVLSVSIKSDGSVDKIDIGRSSGYKVLDDAAINMVKLAAPYTAFPPDIAKDTDIIDITRTWTFTSTDRLQTQ